MIEAMKATLVNTLLRFPRNPVTDRAVRRLIRPAPHTTTRAMDTRMGYRLNLTPDPALFDLRCAVVLGQYEASYIDVLSRLVTRGDTAIDVGANEGFVTLRLAQRVGPTGRIYAIEPLPANVDRLKANLRINGLTNVSVYEVALSDEIGRLDLYGDGAWGTLTKDLGYQSTVTVDIQTIDSLLPDPAALERVSLMKIDVEGHEARVIRGAEKLIAKARPVIAFEINLTILAYQTTSIGELLRFFTTHSYDLLVESEGRLQQFEWLNERIMNCVAIPLERVADYSTRVRIQ